MALNEYLGNKTFILDKFFLKNIKKLVNFRYFIRSLINQLLKIKYIAFLVICEKNIRLYLIKFSSLIKKNSQISQVILK